MAVKKGKVKAAPAALQRGRAQLSAEWAQPRSDVRRDVRLQRGRAQLSAECSWGFCRGCRGFGASTGPRSIERGMLGIAAHAVTALKLQRGRAQLSAEW